MPTCWHRDKILKIFGEQMTGWMVLEQQKLDFTVAPFALPAMYLGIFSRISK